ncbi:PKD domain-containing protein [Hymenobacter sp. B81]|uniref:PKD domain-containing protein n=1 Tax=Hymenobacter sp. B81 TaxID=3344878 RepID=UPI0037DC68B8
MMKTFIARFLMILLLLNTAACKETEEEPQPQADFTFTEPLRSRAPIRFEATAPGATKYRWDFGDGGKDSVANPTHTFAAVGNYTVTLAVDGPNGAASKSKTLLVEAPLSIHIQTLGDHWDGVPISFTTIATSWATSYRWDFGDGTISTAPNPSHAFALPGTYSVTLTATGAAGSATAAKSLVVTSVVDISTGLIGRYRCGRVSRSMMMPGMPAPNVTLLPVDTIAVSMLADGRLKLQANGSLRTVLGLYPSMKLYPGTGGILWGFPAYWYSGSDWVRPSEDAYFEKQGNRLIYRQWTGGNGGGDVYTCDCQKL